MDTEFQTLLNKDVYFVTYNLGGTLSQTANNFGYFFTPTLAVEILAVVEKHTAASGAATTLDVLIVPNATAISSGVSVLASTFALNSTANTAVTKIGTGLSNANRTVKPNQSLALKNSADNATLQGVSVTVFYKYPTRGSYRKAQ